MAKGDVPGKTIAIQSMNMQDYSSLTDMARGIENGLALIEKWLRNKKKKR
ncbi:MAG: KilA-N domain-containing protein [Chitinispirillaceae bacterium]|nr:KilA-N domain-containing protein [Chitinispirillaceae bacterium]